MIQLIWRRVGKRGGDLVNVVNDWYKEKEPKLWIYYLIFTYDLTYFGII
jgi:hypothetical protein